ncbi:uncharacterized protein LOC116765791 isoform X1 [Danaus plexippus]|uniref:uncharacterized protein LOC116765791 isoform X1 n=1 Tax=Danaus plexippus TaxID=13037 RepID=UPI002AB2F0B1|nr:uncharacterized protein LOC116765791 isoform X1 [Danaus plexippus]
MDEIYTDLDNYNDVNLVEELKSENKDLKFKLEEYSSALHRLQKNILQDFDKLSGEFKNLERNYSSLLKTARAEIERKTETIKNLNLEKDQLVIKSLQKGKNILQNRRSNFKDVHQNKNYEVKQNDKESAGKLDNLSQYKTQTSVDVVASFVSENKSNHTENITSKIPNNKLSSEENKERDRKNKTHRNENAHQSETIKKIIDRRKSTNFPECEPTFSSDEDSRKTITEQQQNSSHKDAWQNEKRHDQQDHLNPLPYEHYHQPLQPSYRNRSSRYNEYDRQRTHDHYDTYDKPRRYYSPDNHYRYGKDTSDNYNQRENKRDRRYERSPVTDRYNRAKSRDRRNNFERENYYDHGKKTHHTSDLPAKRPYELEEPSSKRLKIDSYTRHTNIDKEKEFVERHTYTNAQGLQDPSTCQSPDYTHIDSNVHHSVKEIIHTALTPLQDPRLLSNKYILKSNSEKPILMTVAGSNVDIVPITSWGADRSSKATKPNDAKLPSDKGIRNSGQNLSTESGEIHSVNEDQPIEIFPNITELKSDISKNSSGIVDTNQQTASRDVGKSINLYKIPRLKKTGDSKKTNNLKEKSDEPKKLEELGKDFRVIVEGKHLSEKSPENIIDTAKNKTTSAKTRGDKSKSILQKLIDETELSDVPGNINIPETKLVNISTIEGDLELSDETSDNMDLITEDSMKNEAREGISHGVNNKQIQLSLDKETSNKADDKVKRSKDSRKSSHSRRDSVKEKVRETSKRRRTKKQSDLEECNVLKDKSPPTKENIELEDKPNIFSQTKNKFTDLFGDSNSLITPDDLGLPVVSPLNTGKFDSMFENTQDAVDLSDEQVRTVKALKDIDNTEDAETSKEALIQDAVSNTESKKSNDNRHNGNKPASISKEEDNPSALIYGNVKADNASDVIKTIIISTGTQPQCVSRDTEFPRGDNVQKQFDFQKGTFSTAIATSTPYKLDSSQISPAVDSTLMPRQFTNNKLDQNDLTSHTTVGSNTNENKIKNDSDVPDVRIFVKRRKKVTKKPA